MPLQPPPLLQSLLLESPWPVMLTLLLAAVVLAAVGWQRASRRLLWAAGGLVLLAGAVVLVASLVATPRERVMARTTQLINLTAPLNLAELRTLFAPRATLSGPFGQVWLTHDVLFEELEYAVNRWPIGSHSIRDLQAQVSQGGQAVSAVHLWTTLNPDQGPIFSRWTLNWQRDADGQWRVNDVRWIEIQNAAPSQGMWR